VLSQIDSDFHMLSEKDLINLELCTIDGFIRQLSVQEGSILHLVRPDELLASTQIAMEKDYLDGLYKNASERLDKLLLTEANTD
jgi:hypothetical protein